VTCTREGDTLVRLDSNSDFINLRHLLLWVLILGNIFFKASSAAIAESLVWVLREISGSRSHRLVFGVLN
jgi:hypothetical protein